MRFQCVCVCVWMDGWMTAEQVPVRLGRGSRYVGRMDWVGWLVGD